MEEIRTRKNPNTETFHGVKVSVVEVQYLSNPIYLSNIFAFEKINHFSAVVSYCIEKDLNFKAPFSAIKYYLTSAINSESCKILW